MDQSDCEGQLCLFIRDRFTTETWREVKHFVQVSAQPCNQHEIHQMHNSLLGSDATVILLSDTYFLLGELESHEAFHRAGQSRVLRTDNYTASEPVAYNPLRILERSIQATRGPARTLAPNPIAAARSLGYIGAEWFSRIRSLREVRNWNDRRYL